MNEELRDARGEGFQHNAGEDERRRSRSESSPATRPAGDPLLGPERVADSANDATHGLTANDEEASSGQRTSQSPGANTADDALGWDEDPLPPVHLEPLLSKLTARRRAARTGGALARPQRPQMPLSPQQKLLLLDTWQRSGLPARDFGALVNISRHTLYAWKRQFQQHGPAGLMEQPRGVRQGSRLPELTKRSILMLKQAHPEWGCQRISDMLLRVIGAERRTYRYVNRP